MNEFAELIRLTILQLSISELPRKKAPTGSTNKHRHVLYRKRRKLNSRLKCLKHHQPNSPTIAKIDTELNLIEYQIRETIVKDQIAKEDAAVAKIVSNPRYFFSYAKRFSSLKSNIGPLKDPDGHLNHNPVDMANILQK